MTNKIYLGKTLGSFLIVLLLMPIGHAIMILMEHLLDPTTLHYAAFSMGFAGLLGTGHSHCVLEFGRSGYPPWFFREIWVDPMGHVVEMSIIAGVFIALVAGFWMYNATDKN